MTRYSRLLKTTVIISLILLLIIGGCGKKPQKKPGGGGGKQLKIGASMATLEGDGYSTFQKTVDKGAKKEKAKVTWKDAKNDPLEQAVNVDELIKAKVKAVIFHAVDPTQSSKLVKKLIQGKIKVLALERLPLNVQLDGFVVPDFRRAGELQGDYLVTSGVKGSVLVLSPSKEETSSTDLWEGFQSEIAGQGITPIRVIIPAIARVDTATDRVTAALKANTGVKAIVAQSGTITDALMAAMKEQPGSDKIVTVGIGAGKAAATAMAMKKHDAEVDTRPDFMGDQALKAIMLLAKGKTLEYDNLVRNDNIDVPTRVIPVRLITRDNLYLLEERWKKELKKAKEQQKKSKSGSSGGGGGSKGSGGGGSGGSGGDKGKSGGQKTMVKITTKEGKTMQVEVEGEITKIETQGGGGGKAGGGGKSGGGGGGQSGGGSGGGGQ